MPSMYNPLNWLRSDPQPSPTVHKKRKVDSGLGRASKAARLAREQTPRYSNEDYTSANFYEGSIYDAPKPSPYHSNAGQTYLQYPKVGRGSIPGPRKTLVPKPPSAKPISPTSKREIAEKRLAHLTKKKGDDPELKEIAKLVKQLKGKTEAAVESESEMEPPFDLPPLQEFQPEDVEEDDVVSEPIVQSSSKNPESSIHPEWREKPNKRARTLLSQFGDGAGRKILQEVKEPEYAAIDAEVRDGLWQIMDEMEIVAKKFFDFDFLGGSSLTAAFSSMTPETVKVIGCVASGGPGGEEGWRQLFKNKHQRHALVCAIIGNVIVEQVLQHVFFGGDMEDVEALTDIQRDHQHEDGFERNRLYAAHIRKVLGPKPRTIKLPHNFEDQTKVIVAAIYTHLKPILSLNPAFAKHDTALSTAIYKIVAEAGILSILMRLDPHTVYYLTPTFKEDTFSSKYMDCFNKKQMEATHPRDRHAESWPAGTTDEEKRRAQGDEPLTRITLMDGVTAYRRGGWETTDSTPQTPKYTDGNENKGIRCRVLTHGWVFCRWGRARKFDKGVPKDDPKVHGREWKAPGFVEFKQVRGVPQPPPPPPAKRV